MAKQRFTILRKLRNLILFVCVGFILLSLITVVSLRWINPPISAFMLQHIFTSDVPLQYHWVASNKISNHLAIAAVASEDQKFPQHHGFDFQEIQSALIDSSQGKSLRGASTITQQVAKNIFLWSGRSVIRKLLEAYFTVLIEFCWNKPRILEVYLNIAEMGNGIYGVQAASQFYYKKDARLLNVIEASRLIAALPNPKKYRVQPASPYVAKRAAQIQQQIKQLGGYQYLLSK